MTRVVVSYYNMTSGAKLPTPTPGKELVPVTEGTKKRSIFDLSAEDLEQIVQTNKLPPDVTYEGIQDRKEFDRLFSHRHNPKYIAAALIKEKKNQGKVGETAEMKERRLAAQERSLELKAKKIEGDTVRYQTIQTTLKKLERKIDYLTQLVLDLDNREDIEPDTEGDGEGDED